MEKSQGSFGRTGGELERVAECSENNFSKVLDDTAKADQNLASLLLTTKRESELIKVAGEAKLLSIAKRNFQKYLTTKQKAD